MRDRRMVKLTSLAPDIVEAILDDALPSGSTLFDFSDDVPLLWEEQRELLPNAGRKPRHQVLV